MSTFASRDGTVLHELVWSADKPRGRVALVHGYGEHIARYDELGNALAKRGFATRGCDFRGHGQSAGVRGHIDRFDEYLDDLAALLARSSADHGELPLFLVSHSMGALVACEYILRRGSQGIVGLVLSSPYFALKLKVSPIKIGVGKLASRLMPKLALPSGLAGKDVARDPALAAAYDTDPLNNKNATARWFTEATAAQAHVAASASELKLPLFMIQGAADHVADPLTSKALFEKFGAADKTLLYLDGQYHEVFNEPPAIRQANIDAVASWLEAKVARS